MRVLVVGRFELERLGVTSMLRSLLTEDTDIGHAQNGPEMLSRIKQEPGFDMLVVDAKAVGKSCVDALAAFDARRSASLKVIVMMEGLAMWREWLEAFPNAWPVDKARPQIEFADAIRSVSQGGRIRRPSQLQ
jgi:CheY-like chemotaxis protein